MLISYKHKFIFIKTRKSAGTSIQAQLRTHCGEDDTITAVAPAEGFPDSFNKGLNSEGWFPHDGWTKVRREVGKKIWEKYFVFSFERNSWDKIVSHYHWDSYFSLARGDDEVPFGYYCERVAGQLSDFELYGIKDGLAVDFVGQYETLEEDYKYVCSEIGIKYSELPKLKAFSRPVPKKPYQSYYTDETKKIIEKHFAREINLFGYTCE